MAWYIASMMFPRTFKEESLELSWGLTRLERKIKTIFFAGSAHTQVPVNPVCPKVWGEAEMQG